MLLTVQTLRAVCENASLRGVKIDFSVCSTEAFDKGQPSISPFHPHEARPQHEI